MDDSAPGARRSRSPETWAAARADYLAGARAATVCARFDLGLSALRARARREGWRRTDQADPDPVDAQAPDPDLIEDLDEELEAQGPADLAAMTERASRLADRALGLGRLVEAQGWMRVWRQLRGALEAEQDSAERRSRREIAELERGVGDLGREVRNAVRSTKLQADLLALQPTLAKLAKAPANVHSVHSVHPESEFTSEAAVPGHPPNRAGRRRAAKLAAAQQRPRSGGP